MRCPYCSYEESKVVDSRSAEDYNAIRRRRECLRCSKRYTTYEKVEDIPILVIKKDLSRGEMIMERLKDIDEVSYVRFASVYRQFKDINTFMEEIKSLMK